MRKKVTAVSISVIVAIIVGIITISGKACDLINRHIEKVSMEIIEKDPRMMILYDIKKDLNEVKQLLELMHYDDPNYKKAKEVISSGRSD